MRKNNWALLVKRCVFCTFGKEEGSRAWFLNLLGLDFNTCFETQFFHGFASLRDEIRIVTSAKGSVLVWLVLAVVAYSCGRRTEAPEPVLLVHLDPKMSLFLGVCRHVLGVEWELFLRWGELLGCLFHVT